MILVIGLVVDDAIIVVERVQYLMLNENLPAYEASVKAMQQIGSAIVATTFVLLAIFVPVGLMASRERFISNLPLPSVHRSFFPHSTL